MSGVSRNYPDGNGKLQRFEYDENEEQVITQRFPQTALLLLDSLDRYNLDPLTDRYQRPPLINPNNIYINHQKLNGFGEIKRISTTDISFPWLTPNVNERNNNFYLRVADDNIGTNAQDYFINLGEGFYKPSELATGLAFEMNSVGWNDNSGNTGINLGTWTVTTSPINCAFTVTNTSGKFFQYVSTTSPIIQKNKSNFSPLMNFFPPETGWVAGFQGGTPTMAYTQYIDFVSNALTNFQRLKDSLTQFNYTNVVYRLYLNNGLNMAVSDDNFFGSRPSYIYRQISNPKQMLWNKNQMLSYIDMKLYDDSGNLLYIPQAEWSSADYLMGFHMSES